MGTAFRRGPTSSATPRRGTDAGPKRLGHRCAGSGSPDPNLFNPQESRPSPPSERLSARYRSRIDDLPAEGSSSGVQ